MNVDVLKISEQVRPTKGEAAESATNGMTYDTALPQGWVDAMYERGFDHAELIGNFVWAYPSGDVSGVPYPITQDGLIIMAKSLRMG